MVFASHHVIKDIQDVLESGNIKELREITKKFCERYPKDEELMHIICGEKSVLEEYILTRKDEALGNLKKELHDLWNLRQLESSGGEKLWFKDRRP